MFVHVGPSLAQPQESENQVVVLMGMAEYQKLRAHTWQRRLHESGGTSGRLEGSSSLVSQNRHLRDPEIRHVVGEPMIANRVRERPLSVRTVSGNSCSLSSLVNSALSLVVGRLTAVLGVSHSLFTVLAINTHPHPIPLSSTPPSASHQWTRTQRQR